MPKDKVVCTPVGKVDLPDGLYTGNWGGYTVLIPDENGPTLFQVREGIHTPNFPVTVIIKDHEASVYRVDRKEI
jgi:hypothetical protein